VSPNYVKKIESEMRNDGRVLHPEDKKLKQKIGLCANSLGYLGFICPAYFVSPHLNIAGMYAKRELL
jgi:hypothetical protein